MEALMISFIIKSAFIYVQGTGAYFSEFKDLLL